MDSWKLGIKDACDVVEELIEEYKDLHTNQQARVAAGLGDKRLAVDYVLVINALKRVLDLLQDLDPPESKDLSIV